MRNVARQETQHPLQGNSDAEELLKFCSLTVPVSSADEIHPRFCMSRIGAREYRCARRSMSLTSASATDRRYCESHLSHSSGVFPKAAANAFAMSALTPLLSFTMRLIACFSVTRNRAELVLRPSPLLELFPENPARMDWSESKELILFRHKCIKYKRCKKVKYHHTILLTNLVRSSIMYSMNRLDISRKVQIVSAFVEGNGVRATARMTDCSPVTVL